MAPDIGQRIDAILQALSDVVMPAIDPTQKAAKEQLGYAMAALQLIVIQHDKAYHLAIMEVRLFAELLLRLDEAAGDTLAPELRSRLRSIDAAKFIDLQTPAQDSLDVLQRQFREIADAVVAAMSMSADSRVRQLVTEIVVNHSAAEMTMRRGWMAVPGVEANLSMLPTREEIIAPAVRSVSAT